MIGILSTIGLVAVICCVMFVTYCSCQALENQQNIKKIVDHIKEQEESKDE